MSRAFHLSGVCFALLLVALALPALPTRAASLPPSSATRRFASPSPSPAASPSPSPSPTHSASPLPSPSPRLSPTPSTSPLPARRVAPSLPVLPFETITVRSMAARRSSPAPNFERHLSALLSVLVTSYHAHHRAARSLCVSDASLAARARVLIFRGNPNAGIGDRTRGILFAYLIAAMSERLLLLDQSEPFALSLMWANPPGLNFSYDPALFPAADMYKSRGTRLPDTQFDETFVTAREYNVPHRTLVLHRMPVFDPMRDLSFRASFPDFHARLRAAGVPDGLDVRPEELAPFLLRAVLRPGRVLRERLRDACPFDGKQFVAAHARLGVGTGEQDIGRFEFWHDGLSTREVARCVGRAAGAVARRKGLRKVFVATDSPQMKATIRQGVKERLQDAVVVFAKGEPMHIGELRKVNSANRRGLKKKFEGFVRTFVDVGLLAMGETMVHISSGFVDVAVWMAAVTDRQTLQVKECMKDNGKDGNGGVKR